MKTYLIIDTNHLINRARHSVNADISVQTGMALNIIFFSIKKLWNEFGADHIIFTFDSKSWRRDYFPEYKLARRIKKESVTVEEKANDEYFWEAMNDFQQFLVEKTNCTVLCKEPFEGDDLIARFIDLHPSDKHIIVSGDNDFIQLVRPGVIVYNGVTETYIRHDGVYDAKGRPAFFVFKNDGKISIPKKIEKNSVPPTLGSDWVERSLFFKILRGDEGDGVFTAVKPGTRQTKLEEAFDDKKNKGFIFNNFMLQEWKDHNDVIKRVIDRYNENKTLIDLRSQPENIVNDMDVYISSVLEKSERKSQIGIWIMKFSNKYELKKVSDAAKDFSPCFSAHYPLEDLLKG
jgi:5'-3' exonuclease